MQLLVTGATGKVGVNLIERLLSDPRWRVARVRALCHNRTTRARRYGAERDRLSNFLGFCVTQITAQVRDLCVNCPCLS
jgi:nucleoside-diphosphate-sugar epimerase